MTRRRRPERPPQPEPGVELALVLVHVSVALGFARLFEGTSFVAPLLGFVLGAHALAIAVRRSRAPGVLALPVALLGAVLAATWLLFPETTTLGLPTSATWEAARAALADARARYPEVIAPTEAVPGFLLAGGLALWLAAWFADWTAHRLRAGAEAIAPAAAVFTFCAILGSGRYELASAAALAASSLVFLGLQRASLLRREQSWSPDQPAASRSLVRSAAAIGAVAVLAGCLVGPTLPGARSEATLDWRGGSRGDRSRVTVSPMVELRRRLVDQSDEQVFQVTSDVRSYWRLTSLDRFDGEIWSSDGEFRPADDELPERVPDDLDGPLVHQAIEIDGLAAIWAPAAFEPVSVSSPDQDLRWDPASSTLIVDADAPTSDGLTYRVVSRAPAHDPAALAAAGSRDPAAIADRYEALPDDFPAMAADLAREVTRRSPDRYAAALALQAHFRTYEYSLSVPAGHGDDALVDFLQRRVGYCEQFAGAYAAMARSLGIPARVAVGFTPGEQDPRDPDQYIVRGRHAHAWPEVYFPDIGWVPFEPTPGRGIPGAERYTGVAPQQDDAVGAEPPASSTTPDDPTVTTTAVRPPSSTTPQQRQDPAEVETRPSTPATGRDRGLPWPLVAVIVAGAGAALAWRRRRARTVSAPLGGRLGPDGPAGDPAATPLEVAVRAGELHPAAAADLEALALLVGEERWSAEAALGADDIARVEELRRALAVALADRPPVGTRG